MSQQIRSIPGMNDILPVDASLWQRLENTAREVFEAYGFKEIRTPLLEETALFSRGVGEGTQVVKKEMYTFLDKGGDSVTLRPEGTASVVRSYLQNSLSAADAITKLYYLGPMFRYERPQKGRMRQFHQIGVETLGIDSPLADAEVVILLDRLVKKLGIQNYQVQVNSLGTAGERQEYLKILTRFLESKKKNVCPDCQERIATNPLRVMDCKEEVCQKQFKDAPLMLDHLSETSKAEFELFQKTLEQAAVEFIVNPRIVRGLDYYEKTAFEFTSSELGSQSAFAGGGRYNNLVQELGGDSVPGVGWALGCERLVMLMQIEQEKNPVPKELSGIYFVAMGETCFGKARELLQKLRDAGVKAEMDYSSKSFKSQMRRADKLGFKYAAILGENELTKNVVMLKDLGTGEQKEVGINDLIRCL